jgi:hypothetical protein
MSSVASEVDPAKRLPSFDEAGPPGFPPLEAGPADELASLPLVEDPWALSVAAFDAGLFVLPELVPHPLVHVAHKTPANTRTRAARTHTMLYLP